MQTSENGILFIANEEGYRSKPYLDAAGIATIGHGTICYPNGVRVTMKDKATTKVEAVRYLRHDVKRFEDAANKYFGETPLKQNQYDSIISFLYNVGEGGLQSSLCTQIRKNPAERSTKPVDQMEDPAVQKYL